MNQPKCSHELKTMLGMIVAIALAGGRRYEFALDSFEVYPDVSVILWAAKFALMGMNQTQALIFTLELYNQHVGEPYVPVRYLIPDTLISTISE